LLLYYVTRKYDPHDPDEQREEWNKFPFAWAPEFHSFERTRRGTRANITAMRSRQGRPIQAIGGGFYQHRRRAYRAGARYRRNRRAVELGER
jgi:hypothetical protein